MKVFVLCLLYLLICSATFGQDISSEFSVNVELLLPVKREEVQLKIFVTNVSNKRVKVFKDRRQDYKREKIRALGNYVIEIERFEKDKYILFTPSADLNPIFENQEHILLGKGNSITDTLYIDGYSFSRRTAEKRGFPTGQYRVRVYFNLDMRNCNEENRSNWIEFKIE